MERPAPASRSTVALFFLAGYAGVFVVCLTGQRLSTKQSAWAALLVAAIPTGMAWSWPRLRGGSDGLLAPLVLLATPTLLMVVVFWLSMVRTLPGMGATTGMFATWIALGAAACWAAWRAPRALPTSRVRTLGVTITLGGVMIFVAGVVWIFTPLYSHRKSLFDAIVKFFQRRF